MIYNVDVFKQFNLEVPKTVEELDQIVGTLLDNGVTPIALPSDNWVPQIWMTSGFSRALGTDEACEEATNKILTNQAVFNDYPEFAVVIDDYLNMFEKGYFNSDYLTVDYDTVLDRLVTGETAMLYGATSILNTIQSSYPDANLEMFNPPVSYDQKDLLSTCYYSFGLGIPKTSKNIDAVKKVFQLWSTPEYCDLFFEDQPGFPNLEGVNGNQQLFSSSVNEIYEDYVGSGRTVTEMNEHWAPSSRSLLQSFGFISWKLPQRNVTGKLFWNGQEDVAQYMSGKKAEGWSERKTGRLQCSLPALDRRTTMHSQSNKNIYPFWMLLPALAVYTVFTIVPVVISIALSFTDWNIERLYAPEWKGVSNFITLFQDDIFLRSIGNTLIFALFTTVLKTVGGLLLALALL